MKMPTDPVVEINQKYLKRMVIEYQALIQAIGKYGDTLQSTSTSWRDTILSSGMVNQKVTFLDVYVTPEGWHYVRPFLLEMGCLRIYSDPFDFLIGKQSLKKGNIVPQDGWEAIMRGQKIPEAIINEARGCLTYTLPPMNPPTTAPELPE